MGGIVSKKCVLSHFELIYDSFLCIKIFIHIRMHWHFVPFSQEYLYNPSAKKGSIFHKFRNAKAVSTKKSKTGLVQNNEMTENELKSETFPYR